jgi:hypothetical protein
MLISVLLCVSFASTPLLIASITVPSVAKANISPTAVSTLGDITPIGGTMKDAINKPIANIKHM